MKYITGAITGAFLMTLAVNPSNSLNVTTPDEAAIKTIVESVASLADTENKFYPIFDG